MRVQFAVLLAAFFVLPVTAQSDRWFDRQPLPQVRQFLELTDSQVQAILQTNEEYNRFSAEKQSRIYQVQTEIAEETAREPLEPIALGIRYAEIEAICRHLRDEALRHRNRNLQVLNDAQRARLKVLEDAMKLIPTITEAQFGNLLGSPGYAPPMFTSASSRMSTAGATIGSVWGCGGPALIGGLIRAGVPAAARATRAEAP